VLAKLENALPVTAPSALPYELIVRGTTARISSARTAANGPSDQESGDRNSIPR
jgi:hypothetical protein